MTRLWDVICAGDIYIDHVLTGFEQWPEPGSEVFAPSYLRELGGGAAITACALGRLGRKTAVLGIVGQEEFPWIAARLSQFQVDCSALEQHPGHTGTTISISTAQDRSFLSYKGPNEQLSEHLSDPAVIHQLTQARHVHLAIALPRKVANLLLSALHAAGTTVSIDPGWQPEWYRELENLETCKQADLFLPNRKEAANILGMAQESLTPEVLALAINQAGFPNAVLKLGATGAIATSVPNHRVPAPPTTAIDTTGAGDAFDAGLIDAYLERASSEAQLRRGCIVGSLSVRVAGALAGLPRRQQIEEMHEHVYQS